MSQYRFSPCRGFKCDTQNEYVIKLKTKINCGTYFRYTYNWFTRYPKTIFLHSQDQMAKLVSLPECTVKADEVSPQTESQQVVPGLEMEDTGGFCSIVVALMATKQVNGYTVFIPSSAPGVVQ